MHWQIVPCPGQQEKPHYGIGVLAGMVQDGKANYEYEYQLHNTNTNGSYVRNTNINAS